MNLPLADVNYVEATWVMVVKSIVIFLGVFLIVPVLTVAERKLIGRFQNRYGPNRVGPVGLVQPLADIVKLAGKEMFRPQAANARRPLHKPAGQSPVPGNEAAGELALRRPRRCRSCE